MHSEGKRGEGFPTHQWEATQEMVNHIRHRASASVAPPCSLPPPPGSFPTAARLPMGSHAGSMTGVSVRSGSSPRSKMSLSTTTCVSLDTCRHHIMGMGKSELRSDRQTAESILAARTATVGIPTKRARPHKTSQDLARPHKTRQDTTRHRDAMRCTAVFSPLRLVENLNTPASK